MGAPIKQWLFRGALSAAIAAGIVLLLSAPAAPWLRLGLLAVAVAIGLDQAFRRVPAFDPLGRIRWRVPHAHATKCCAITFDDGPSPWTAAVLDVLAAERVPATFFVLGANVERHPALVQRAYGEGHAVGIHGMDHSRLTRAIEPEIERQVLGVTALLERLGVKPSPIYRTPHGCKSPGVLAVARRHGLTLWAWSRGVWDTERPAPGVLVRRATRWARSGMVLLLHDGRGVEREPDVTSMLAALPQILQELKRRGFAFVRVGDL